MEGNASRMPSMRIRLVVAVCLLFVAAAAHAQLESDPAYGLSSDFRNWLTANGYGSYGFARTDVPGGSYGGRVFAGQAAVMDRDAGAQPLRGPPRCTRATE